MAATAASSAEVFCGTTRQSMKTNALLQKAEIGKSKKSVMFSFPDNTVFGSKTTGDLEGAKDVTMFWQEHQPNPHAKPGPDFKAMNKLAATKGLTNVKDVPAFRQTHAITLKKRESLSKAPQLPSDKDPSFTYGEPGSYRTAEQMRWQGATETPIKYLIQGVFQQDWVRMNLDRQAHAPQNKTYLKPTATKATLGHAKGAKELPAAQVPQAYSATQWKMTKFAKVAPKVTQYMSSATDPQAEEAVCSADVPQEAAADTTS